MSCRGALTVLWRTEAFAHHRGQCTFYFWCSTNELEFLQSRYNRIEHVQRQVAKERIREREREPGRAANSTTIC